MRDPVGRILLVLAGLDVSPSDLRAFFKWMEEQRPEGAYAAIEKARQLTRSVENMSRGGLTKKYGIPSDYRSDSDVALIRRVEHLLLLEGNLPKSQIVRFFSEKLKERGYPIKSLPSSSKLSFRAWLEKLSRRVPPGELLNVASLIRNELVHGKRMDWPLRRDST